MKIRAVVAAVMMIGALPTAGCVSPAAAPGDQQPKSSADVARPAQRRPPPTGGSRRIDYPREGSPAQIAPMLRRTKTVYLACDEEMDQESCRFTLNALAAALTSEKVDVVQADQPQPAPGVMSSTVSNLWGPRFQVDLELLQPSGPSGPSLYLAGACFDLESKGPAGKGGIQLPRWSQIVSGGVVGPMEADKAAAAEALARTFAAYWLGLSPPTPPAPITAENSPVDVYQPCAAATQRTLIPAQISLDLPGDYAPPEEPAPTITPLFSQNGIDVYAVRINRFGPASFEPLALFILQDEHARLKFLRTLIASGAVTWAYFDARTNTQDWKPIVNLKYLTQRFEWASTATGPEPLIQAATYYAPPACDSVSDPPGARPSSMIGIFVPASPVPISRGSLTYKAAVALRQFASQ